ncbi:MAG: PhnD/SsuA/transferrin family substrate-binding protein [Proteobacteria bacterium]|nr:PhnD/SsuA/transferrin family substrate-binding protein [Pseudomonadota bacterium]
MKLRKKLILILFIVFNFPLELKAQQKILYQIFLHGEDSIAIYSELTRYISQKTKKNYISVFEENSKSAAQKIFNKETSLGFLCSGPYVIYRKDFYLEPLVTIKPIQDRSYRSYIFVRKEKPYKDLKDLKGKSFSYAYLESFTGRLIPISMIKDLKEDPQKFFSEITYSKNHHQSIINVLEGKAEGGAAMSFVYEHISDINPEIKTKLKVIEKSKIYSPPLFVTSKYTSQKVKRKLKDILLNMHKDPKGKEVLKKMEIEKFVEIKDIKAYDEIESVINSVKEFLP